MPPCPPRLSTCLIQPPKEVALSAVAADLDVVAAGLAPVLVGVLVDEGVSVGSYALIRVHVLSLSSTAIVRQDPEREQVVKALSPG